MCKGIDELVARGEMRGRTQAEAGMITKMYNNGFTAEQIAAAIDKDIVDVKTILEMKPAVLA